MGGFESAMNDSGTVPWTIRAATSADWPAIWSILQPVFRAGETYAVDPDIDASSAQSYWLEQPNACLVAVSVWGEIVGTYYLKTNQPGPGNHVCNCGYVVSAEARGQGVASALCRHSLDLARSLGYRAMQYNFVAATNVGAVRLWQSLGFDIVGTLPGAFHHPTRGDVDAHVMYQVL